MGAGLESGPALDTVHRFVITRKNSVGPSQAEEGKASAVRAESTSQGAKHHPAGVTDWIEWNPQRVQQADIIVGIPSFNEAECIPFVTEQAAIGLKTYFKDCRSVLINCDNHSEDETRQAFLSADSADIPKIYLSTPAGVKGKGNNVRNLIRKAVALEAQAVVVVDADLRSITPRWIKNLGEPLFQNYGYVAPIYTRHKYDATITSQIAYPLSRALYGRRMRQPIGGDFGFSGDMASLYLECRLWDESVAFYGIDIWMTTLALNSPYRTAQAFLGGPKIRRAKDPTATLGPMFRHVMSTFFRLMVSFEETWRGVRWSKPTPIFGFGMGESEVPPPVEVNGKGFHRDFVDGFKAYARVYEETLTQEVFLKTREIAGLPYDRFELPPGLWAKIVYDFALGFHRNVVPRDELIGAFVPLYFGRTGSYVRATQGMEARAVEDSIEEQCEIFEETKPYLVDRWVAAKG
jgi:glycosyltransferase involved in cell wall biosynthesis